MTVYWKSGIGICMCHPPLKKFDVTDEKGNITGYEMRFAWEDDCSYCGKKWNEHK